MPETDVAGNLPLMASDDLNEVDKVNYLTVFYKSAFTKDMLREVDYLSEMSHWLPITMCLLIHLYTFSFH